MIERLALLAYVNPGTGSLVLQFLLVGMAGLWVTFRRSWQWMKARWLRDPSPKQLRERERQ